MSIFGSMRTSVSGMNAQANVLSTVSDNISNASTTAYKEASTSFSSLVLPSNAGNYNSGGVETNVRYSISQQGGLSYTTSGTDLAVQGDGFFIVQDASGTPYLTRAGDFQPDSSGNLVNSAGFSLMGYSFDAGSPSVVVNGFSGLVPINVDQNGLTAIESTQGSYQGNLNADDKSLTGDIAFDNAADSQYSEKSSVIAYDAQGHAITYDVYFSKTNDNEWDVSVYNHADASSGGFPYGGSGLIANETMTFDAKGQLLTGGSLTIQDPSTGDPTATPPVPPLTINMDMSSFTQLAADFTATGDVNGQAPNPIKSIAIGKDGVVSAQYDDGSSKSLYRIPLATVPSEDNLTVLSGNVYSANGTSGVTVTGFPQSGDFGYIQSGALEQSNVDLATELTNMIEAQKSYTANSKVFQTGSDLLDVLVNLQR